MKYKRLLSPITINGMELKNRHIMQPIHLVYSPDGYCNDKFKEFYYRRAEGGTALFIVGGCRFDDYGAAAGMISLRDDSYIPGYKEFTDGMHARGAKVAVQLYHAGAYTHSSHCINGRDPVAPSEIRSKFTKEVVREMTRDELEEIIENWAAGALRAKKAGFDGVEILGSAGYLICQFLSPVTNHRTDEYGGSWENRTRFPRRVFKAVRDAVGPDFPLWARIAGNDFVPGSNTNKEAVEFAKICEECGLDMINVTGGWHETRVPQLPGDVPRAGFSYLYSAIKKAVNIPVAGSNRINDPDVAEEMLALGQLDLVGGCRTLIADPDFMKKTIAGETDCIRRCVACNQGCLAKTFFGLPVECLVNGIAGHEFEVKKAGEVAPKNILVVGGGPGGCEFAIDAAQLGHKVTIWEKNEEIGGQLPLVATPPAKGEFLSLIKYYKAMLKKLGVTVVTGKCAAAEEIIGAGYDAVVTATGVTPKTINLPVSEEGIEIMTANDVLAGIAIAGKDVVVVGGGSVGCETAQYLAERGSLSAAQLHFLMSRHAETPEELQRLVDRTDRNVSIVEILKKI
ncbi:MAG: FAD-dependent oxidoreductase, partial [Lachnospiraceae bacterium]|nr:FAD-dependent oxidoreductase [Lachnospiraceae bacterium]